jgi:FlaA1/EpsC-like NDP-sugar epimerase
LSFNLEHNEFDDYNLYVMAELSFKGHTVVITGAGGGLGKA